MVPWDGRRRTPSRCVAGEMDGAGGGEEEEDDEEDDEEDEDEEGRLRAS